MCRLARSRMNGDGSAVGILYASCPFNGVASRLMASNTVSLMPPSLTTLRPSLQLNTVSWIIQALDRLSNLSPHEDQGAIQGSHGATSWTWAMSASAHCPYRSARRSRSSNPSPPQTRQTSRSINRRDPLNQRWEGRVTICSMLVGTLQTAAGPD